MIPRSARFAAALFTFAALATAGCSLNDTSGQKPGQLGNGGFYFSCDDAVACSPYSDDAKKFPSSVSLGSSFAVRFVPTPGAGLDIHFNEAAPNRGITVQPIAGFVSTGPKGLVAVKSGYATLASRDASGQLVDYVIIRVAKPDALVIYKDDDMTKTPVAVDSVALPLGESHSFKAFAQQKKENLAGNLQLEWASSDRSVVEIQSTTDGKVTVVGRASGSATLSATGGTFTQQVPVTVK